MLNKPPEESANHINIFGLLPDNVEFQYHFAYQIYKNIKFLLFKHVLYYGNRYKSIRMHMKS